MKFNSPSFLYLFILVAAPSLLYAQSNHDGNHCAVTKSPFRISMDSGKVVFTKYCISCHQTNGIDSTGIYRPLNNNTVTGDKKTLIAIVINGLTSKEEISGKIYQQTMPPNPEMKDQEIADVLTFIRNSFGNKASSVKVSEVKSTRSKLK